MRKETRLALAALTSTAVVALGVFIYEKRSETSAQVQSSDLQSRLQNQMATARRLSDLRFHSDNIIHKHQMMTSQPANSVNMGMHREQLLNEFKEYEKAESAFHVEQGLHLSWESYKKALTRAFINAPKDKDELQAAKLKAVEARTLYISLIDSTAQTIQAQSRALLSRPENTPSGDGSNGHVVTIVLAAIAALVLIGSMRKSVAGALRMTGGLAMRVRRRRPRAPETAVIADDITVSPTAVKLPRRQRIARRLQSWISSG